MALAADGVALTLASAGRLARLVPVPIEVASLVTLVDTQPRLRRQLERALGAGRADLVLALANAGALALAQGNTGIAVDALHRSAGLAEALTRRAAFEAARDDLAGRPRRDWENERVVAEFLASSRPRPLPPGPVERHADRSLAAGLGGFVGLTALTGAPRRAAGVAVAALPRPARLGREGFAAQLTRVLARRGAHVLDLAALRLLDRIDTIVLDADVLRGDQYLLADVVPLTGADPGEVAVRANALFRARDCAALVTVDGWTLGPVERLALRGRTGARERRELARSSTGPVLGLARGSRLMAVVSVAPEPAQGAELLLAACRRAGCALFLAGEPAAAGDLGPSTADVGVNPAPGFTPVPGGNGLAATVRQLQAEDRGGVLVVSARRAAMGAADVGVGVDGPDGSPAWGAHILVGHELATAALVVEAVPEAVRASRDAVRLAEIGSAAGALTALGGAGARTAARGLVMVNGAAVAALCDGIWRAGELGRRPPPPAVPRTPWHVLPAETCLERLGSAPSGLTGEQAVQRRGEAPPGRMAAPGFVRAVAVELANPLTPILLGGAALSVAAGSVVDAALILSVSLGSAVLGAAQRGRVDRSLARLFAASAVPARVRRDGEELKLTADDLVPGDVITLAAGDVVPADCRLLSAESLEVDESSLTGESLPVAKSPEPVAAAYLAERTSMIYEGTTVAGGRGVGLVVATGTATEAGRTMAATVGPTRLVGVQARLADITSLTLPVTLGASGALLLSGVLHNRPLADTLSAGVALAVAAVPEGLPFLATAAQLAAARRLSAKGALVRNPRTIETLGRVDVLCFDKTGTLTEGRIRLRAVSDGLRTAAADELDGPHRYVLAAGLRATPRRRGRKLPHPTDRAVHKGAAAAGVTREHGVASWSLVARLPFEPGRAYHATVGGTGAPAGADGQEAPGAVLVNVKGAPEVVLPRCVRRRAPEGVLALDERDLARLTKEYGGLAGQGFRILAVAERELDPVSAPGPGELTDDHVADLTFLGFLALADPLRSTAGASLDQLRAAGVQILMITGDHPATAGAVATELGLLGGDEILVTGAELDEFDDGELDALLPRVTVVARGTPAHKTRVVEAYQRLGKTVAMTGDGANDAPAIRLADVGIALGKRGTPAARAAADVVVTDDRIETIIEVLIEGRSMWGSVRKAMGILVGGNLGEIAFTLLGSVATGRSPLSARQLLLVNLLTDLAPALAVALREPDRAEAGGLLREGPERSLGAALNREIAVRATATAGAAGAGWLAARLTGRRRHADTVGLVALVGSQLSQTLLVGRLRGGLLLTTAASVVVLAVVVQTPGISQFFGCTPLGPVGWTIAAAATLVATVLAFRAQPSGA
ncbi:HAD-IC family P-type ATPase [Pseudofrankia sp. BMG5.36]|uniref:cation-translocating P-type ATPase n=1 Tax=Pseudofrankia sp. BMG5.36 TaxID=1834512 RepID=UPI000A6F4A52|nr:HAD-IC family P-type ATPase [Pseudofrankia sp. BMG5.36]